MATWPVGDSCPADVSAILGRIVSGDDGSGGRSLRWGGVGVVSNAVSPLSNPFSDGGGGADDGAHKGEAGREEEGTRRRQGEQQGQHQPWEGSAQDQ